MATDAPAELRGVRDDATPDLATELEARDELLLACREILVTIGTPEAAALLAHIDAVLDLDDDITESRTL